MKDENEPATNISERREKADFFLALSSWQGKLAGRRVLGSCFG